MAGIRHPVTPDERYFAVKGKLWRLSDPGVEAGERARLLRTLMESAPCCEGRQERRGTAMQSWKLTDGSTKRSAPSASVAPSGGTTARPIQPPRREEPSIRRLVLEAAIGLIRGALSRGIRLRSGAIVGNREPRVVIGAFPTIIGAPHGNDGSSRTRPKARGRAATEAHSEIQIFATNVAHIPAKPRTRAAA